MAKLKIPDFKSLEEAADYWDTHSFADYLENPEHVEIEECFARRRILLEIVLAGVECRTICSSLEY